MNRLRIAAALLCAGMLAVPVMAVADDWNPGMKEPADLPNVETPTTTGEPAQEQEPTPAPAPEPEVQETVSDPAASNSGPSAKWDDDPWGAWSGNVSGNPNLESSSEKQQELEQARREWEEKQNQRDEAFREAEQENAALPEEEEEPKKSAGGKAEETAPTELVLPQRQGKTVSPVRYILIGALLAAALCIAIYLFTHPAREEDPEQEQK